MFEGCEQKVISKANRIISVRSGRWQWISLQVNETVSVIGLHLSSRSRRLFKSRWERKRERDYWQDSDENWLEDNESRCLFILPLSHYSEWLVGEQLHSLLLIKKPRAPLDEFIRLSTPPFTPSLHPPAGSASSHPFTSPPPQLELPHPSSLSFFIPPSSICLFFPSSCRARQRVTVTRRRERRWNAIPDREGMKELRGGEKDPFDKWSFSK